MYEAIYGGAQTPGSIELEAIVFTAVL